MKKESYWPLILAAIQIAFVLALCAFMVRRANQARELARREPPWDFSGETTYWNESGGVVFKIYDGKEGPGVPNPTIIEIHQPERVKLVYMDKEKKNDE